MLLNLVFASYRPHRAYQKKLLQKSAINYPYYLKLNYVQTTRKPLYQETVKYMIDFGYFIDNFRVHS